MCTESQFAACLRLEDGTEWAPLRVAPLVTQIRCLTWKSFLPTRPVGCIGPAFRQCAQSLDYRSSARAAGIFLLFSARGTFASSVFSFLHGQNVGKRKAADARSLHKDGAMQDKSSNPLGLAPSTWIAVVIAAMGIFALKQYPFQDPRPPDLWVPEYSHTATEDQDVEARLWQDPLGAVETARKVDDAQAALAQDKNSGEPLETSVCSKVLAESSALKLSLQRVSGVHSARHLCESIAKKPIEASSVLMIGAIVSGAPYAADIETRRRARYAVLAGLYRSGYMPLNNQHVGYVHLAKFYKDPTRANDLAAFEWFVSEIEADPQRPLRPSYVLLLWL